MYHIIINPASRSGRGLKIWNEVVEPVLRRENVSYQSYFSQKCGDVTRLTQEITGGRTSASDSGGTFDNSGGSSSSSNSDRCGGSSSSSNSDRCGSSSSSSNSDRCGGSSSSNSDKPDGSDRRCITLLVLGGDGTVNEALQGISDFSRVRIGYIPTGSSNDLARDLGIRSAADALDCILHKNHVQPMDLGIVTYPDGSQRRFAVSCGIGFDAAVCEEAMHSRFKDTLNKLGLGKLTYLGIALKQLFAAKNIDCRLSLDGASPIHVPKIMFTACMLHRYEGGGFKFCPDAKADDGILNLCVVGNIPKLLVLLALPTAFWGKHYMVKGITPYEAAAVRITTSAPLWIHTDGEVSRRTQEFTVTCEKQILQFFC